MPNYYHALLTWLGIIKKQPAPVNPLAFGLIILIEKFLNYARDENIKDVVIIYERFNKGMRESVYRECQFLEKTNFKTKLYLKKLIHHVNNGDPVKEPVLQFTDFWTCLPFMKEKSFLDIQDYAKQYYNFTDEQNGGNVAIC